MAKIILEPGEKFEHYHSDSSVTEMLEGKVQIEMNAQARTLKVGDKIEVPPATAHTLVNIGSIPAAVLCSH